MKPCELATAKYATHAGSQAYAISLCVNTNNNDNNNNKINKNNEIKSIVTFIFGIL